MKRTIYNIVLIIYAIIAIFVTVCLLSFNKYKVTEFGDNSWILVTNDELGTDYNKGDLVIVNKNGNIEIGDKIFFYNTYSQEMDVTLAAVTNKEVITPAEITYTLEGDYQLSSQYVIGPASNAKAIGTVGSILNVLESRWGFLFLIVLPALLAFLYEIAVVISEVKDIKNEKPAKKATKKKEAKAEETKKDEEVAKKEDEE